MDIVRLDVPLFIRLLELAREDIKCDADIHDLAQAVIARSKEKVVDMADYDALVDFMKSQGKPTDDDDYASDDIRRFRQIVDLANKKQTAYSNNPKEEYAGPDAVTGNAGGGWMNPKHPSDIRGDSIRVYGDN